MAASDWSSARLDLEKALTTIGGEARFEDLREPAQALLETGRARAARRGRPAGVSGPLPAVRHQTRRSPVPRHAVHRHGSGRQPGSRAHLGPPGAGRLRRLESAEARPRLDAYLSDAQKAEVLGDCYQLLLILAETEAQSASDRKPAEKEQHLRKALSFLEQARRLGTPSRAFHLRRARYLNMLGDRAEATQAEKAAQGAALDQVLDHFLMADELYRREKFGEAIKEFDQVLERKPGHFWAQYLNAICLLRQGRPAEARALLSACLAQRSDFVWLYLLRGFAQEELQAWGAADSDFQKASQMPLDENARYVLSVNRGVLRVRQERFEDAIADLKSAIERKPKAYQAYVNLAQAYRRLGKLDLALEQLNRAVELEPGLAHLYRLRARLHLERNEPALALA